MLRWRLNRGVRVSTPGDGGGGAGAIAITAANSRRGYGARV